MKENVPSVSNIYDCIEPVINANAGVEKGEDGSNVVEIEKPDTGVDLEESPRGDVDLEKYPPPTEEERATLRRVSDSIPWSAWAICMVEFAERASYYGVSTVFNNYLQFPLPEGGDGSGAIDPNKPNSHAGALNLGLQTAAAVGLLYKMFAYLVPIFGGWWADTKIGRYPAIVCGVLIGGVAHVIMRFGGAVPALLQAGKGVPPFIVSLFILGIGTGIFKPNIPPTLVDQYAYQREYTRVLESGEKVIIDPETTVSHILILLNAFVNIGSLFSISIVYVEKYRGFWLAFLVPGAIYFVLPVLLAIIYKHTIRKKPTGSDLGRFIFITISALKNSKGNILAKNLWHNVTPSALAEKGIVVGYSEKDVSDVERTWGVVQILLYLPIWYVTYGGMSAVVSNQGAAMTSNGVPSDLFIHFSALTVIVVSPLTDRFIYPFLQRRHIKFARIDRMTFGFCAAILGSIVGAIVQYRVYETSPCGYQASTCEGVSPISIWWQVPSVSLSGLSEVFVSVTANELVYARTPENMRAIVYAICFGTVSVASILGEIIVPIVRDPFLVWAWVVPGVALFIQTMLFTWRHRHMNDDVFMILEEVSGPVIIEKKSSTDNTSKSE